MDTCSKCKLQFPEHLIQSMAVTPHGQPLAYLKICPICALQLTNHLHGLNRTDFDGPLARDLLRQARQFIGEKA